MIFYFWLVGFFINLGIWIVWKDQWKQENENIILYYIRVFLVLSSSWIGVGIVLGRIAQDVKNKA